MGSPPARSRLVTRASPHSPPACAAHFADTYSALKRTYARLIGAVSLPVSLLLGYCSDWSHLLVTMPAEQVAVRMQTTGVGALTALRQIAEEGPGGLRSFYSGIAAYVVLALKPAIQNAVFESLRRRLLERSARTAGKVARELSAAQAFALGAVARAVATLLVFPCTRAKVLLMTRAAAGAGTPAPVTPPRPSPAAGGGRDGGGSGEGSRPVPVAGLREVLLQVVREEGVLALYHGIRPELVKGVLSASVMLMAKEKIAAANRRIFEAAASRAGRSAE